MRFLSLFSGIGGLDLGLERAGWQCVAQVECEPYALAVLEKHWPEVPRYTDVREVSAANLPICDAIVGGFPCQPHSVAGKGLGSADDRNLWPEFARLVAEIRPRWVVGENVPGLDRTMLADVVRDLEALGYEVGVLGLAASTVGAPHKRERRFIVARRVELSDSDGCDAHYRGPTVSDIQWDGASSEPRRHDQQSGTAHASAMGNTQGGAGRAGEGQSCGFINDGRVARDAGPASLADAGIARLQGSIFTKLNNTERRQIASERYASERRPVVANSNGGITQPGVGGIADGLSCGLDGVGPGGAWPNPPGPQADWEAPRLGTKISARAARLKALGNAVVPQVAELVGRAINELCDK